MDEEAEGAVDGASDGRSNGWYKLWIRQQSDERASYESKEILMVQAMEGAMDGTSDGSRSSRRRYMDQEAVDGWCFPRNSRDKQALNRNQYIENENTVNDIDTTK